mgnify:CR=1 FL=1
MALIKCEECGIDLVVDGVLKFESKAVGARVDNMKVLDGKECAFIIGGSPFAYNNKKPKWKNVVIQWFLLTELKIPDGKGISEYSIDNINEACHQLEKGNILGRAIIVF